MVQETFNDLEGRADVLGFDKSNTLSVDAFYDKRRQCYVIHNETEVIDIPKGWGPFKNRIGSHFSITTGEDQFLFLEVLATFYNTHATIDQVDITINNQQSVPILRAA